MTKKRRSWPTKLGFAKLPHAVLPEQSSREELLDANSIYSTGTETSKISLTTSSSKPVKGRFELNMPEWIAQQLREDKVSRAVGILRAWMPERREREATEEKVMAIRVLTKEASVEVVTELKKSRKDIHGTKWQDMKCTYLIHKDVSTEREVGGDAKNVELTVTR